MSSISSHFVFSLFNYNIMVFCLFFNTLIFFYFIQSNLVFFPGFLTHFKRFQNINIFYYNHFIVSLFKKYIFDMFEIYIKVKSEIENKLFFFKKIVNCINKMGGKNFTYLKCIFYHLLTFRRTLNLFQYSIVPMSLCLKISSKTKSHVWTVRFQGTFLKTHLIPYFIFNNKHQSFW